MQGDTLAGPCLLLGRWHSPGMLLGDGDKGMAVGASRVNLSEIELLLVSLLFFFFIFGMFRCLAPDSTGAP